MHMKEKNKTHVSLYTCNHGNIIGSVL